MDRDLNTALHLFALSAVNGNAPGWIQLTPNLTSFSTKDGRGPFTIKSAADVIRTSLQGGPIGIDYDHATDLAAKAGISAPAAGWIEEIAEHGPGNEPGLWGRVEWTTTGAQRVGGKEYRYISPVLLSSKDGTLVAIGRAALTNDPALVMKGLFSIQEMDDVNRKALCDALGLAGTASDSDVLAAVKNGSADTKKKLASALGIPESASDDDLMSAVKKVGAQASTLANVGRVLKAAGLSGDTLDETTTTALCARLSTAPDAQGAAAKAQTLQTQVDDLQKQLASLNMAFAGSTATKEVEAAIAAGKLTPAQKDWAVDYCARDPDGFKKFVGNQPVILKDGRVVEGAPPGPETLTADEKTICAKMGLKEEDFKRTRATMQKESA
jgi:phage I-like protein